MLCNECNKNLATVHLTQVVNGQTSKVHLCEDCAHDITGEGVSFADFGDVLASIPQMIATLFDTADPEEVASLNEASLKCSRCGTSFNDLRETGRVGCSSCYQGFADRMQPLLRRIHGATDHRGKIPARAGKSMMISQRIKNLRNELEHHITSEAFEQAARVRDEIRELEAEHQQGGAG